MTSILQQLIPASNHDNWMAALNGVPLSAAHLPDYNKALARSGLYRPLLYLIETSTLKLICPVAERRFNGYPDLVSLYGNGGASGVGTGGDIIETMREYLAEQGYIAAFINYNQSFDLPIPLGLSHLEQRNTSFVLNLSGSLDDLWDSIGKNNRRQIRNWQKLSAKIVFEQQRLKNAFFEMYPAFMDRLGAAPHYRLSSEVFEGLFDMKELYLIGAEVGGQIVAVRCFLFTSNVADAFLEAYIDGSNIHSRAIYWAAIQHFHRLGIPFFNLGGGIREGDSLAFFKKSFGGAPRPLISLKLILNGEVYKSICRDVGVDASDLSYFPAYYGQI